MELPDAIIHFLWFDGIDETLDNISDFPSIFQIYWNKTLEFIK